MNKTIDRLIGIATQAFRNANKHDPRTMSAGLSYFFVFSLAPLLALSIMLGAIFVGSSQSQSLILGVLENIFGYQVGGLFKTLVSERFLGHTDIIAILIALIFVSWGASRFVLNLSQMLERVLGVNISDGSTAIRESIKKRARSIAYLIPLAALILVVFLLSTILPFVIEGLSHVFPFFPKSMFFYIQAVSIFLIMTVIFSIVYKTMSRGGISWKASVFGSAVASLLFIIIQTLFSIYISYISSSSLYGALGSVFALLVWTYWSLFGLLYGAEVAKVSMDVSIISPIHKFLSKF